MSGTRVEGFPIAEHVTLRSKGSLAPVEKTVRPEVGPVQIITTAFDGPTVEPDGPLIRNVVAINVAQFPDVWGSSNVDDTFMDKYAFGERQAVGEDSRVVEHTIAVSVDQAQDPVPRVLELFRGLVRASVFPWNGNRDNTV